MNDEAAEREAPAARPRAGRIALWVGGAAVVTAALYALRGQWRATLEVASGVHVHWHHVAIASALVLVAYAVLIETWRRCVADAGSALGYAESARIWFVSNLARYIPGALWQMGALAVLAKERGASAAAATSSAVVLTLVNTVAGLLLALALSPSAALPIPGAPPWIAIAAGVAMLAAMRWLAPGLARWAAMRTGADLSVPALGPAMLAIATVGSLVSWAAYGLAFQHFVQGVMPSVALTVGGAIAIYTASYLAGFLSLGPPAGLGVADGAMVWLLVATKAASPAEAAVIAACTRLWRTALEIAPGLLFLALQRSRGSRIP